MTAPRDPDDEAAAAWRRTVDAGYSDEVERFYESGGAALDESLAPRGPELFFDMAEHLGLCATSRALDVGSRDARHIAEVEDRFGCRVTGVEPAPGNLARMRRTWGDRPFAVARAVAESLPFASASFDFIWIRDVLVHVQLLTSAFAECRRVREPGAPILVFHVLETSLMEPGDSARLRHGGAEVPENRDRRVFERAIADAGLRIEHREALGSEWGEYGEEHGGRAGRQLLRLARLLRKPDHFKTLLGEQVYNVEVGNCLYNVYQMIGKLSPALYVLR
jgi:hypothetical protein